MQLASDVRGRMGDVDQEALGGWEKEELRNWGQPGLHRKNLSVGINFFNLL